MSGWVCKTCEDVIPHEHYPTTEGVRRAYVYPSPSGAVWDEQDAEVEFNLWLKYHDEDVAKETEDRIVKLLEEQCVEDSPTGIKILEETTLHYLIELIKGENK